MEEEQSFGKRWSSFWPTWRKVPHPLPCLLNHQLWCPISYLCRNPGAVIPMAGKLILFQSPTERCSGLQQMWGQLGTLKPPWAVIPSPMGPSASLLLNIYLYQVFASRHWTQVSNGYDHPNLSLPPEPSRKLEFKTGHLPPLSSSVEVLPAPSSSSRICLTYLVKSWKKDSI